MNIEGLAEFLKTPRKWSSRKSYTSNIYKYIAVIVLPYSGTPYNPLPGNKKDEKDDKGGKKYDKKSDDKKSEKKSEKAEKPRTRIGAGWQGKNSCQQSMWNEDGDDSIYLYGGYSDQYLGGE